MLIEVVPSGPLGTNCVFLGCTQTKKGVIVDAPLGSLLPLIEIVEKGAFTPEFLLLTHSHWDHIAEVEKIKKKWNIPLYVHREDAQNLEHPGSDGIPLLFPINGVHPDGFLEEGQRFSVGEIRVQVIHTPGHTPGGVCFWLPEENLLLSGDTLFRGTIGSLKFPTSSPERMWESLKKLSSLPKGTRVIPGHGGEMTIQNEPWLEKAKEKFGWIS